MRKVGCILDAGVDDEAKPSFPLHWKAIHTFKASKRRLSAGFCRQVGIARLLVLFTIQVVGMQVNTSNRERSLSAVLTADGQQKHLVEVDGDGITQPRSPKRC